MSRRSRAIPGLLSASLFIAVLLVCTGGCARRPGVVGETAEADLAQPGAAYPTITADGAWCWVGDPRAVYYKGEHRRTYVGWVNARGDIQVAAYDHDTRKIVTTTVREELQRDDHANPSLFVRPDGRLVVFYSGHRGRWMFYRVSQQPEDVTSWVKQTAIAPHTSDNHGHTYPIPVHIPGTDEAIRLFWRGPAYDFVSATTIDGESWSAWQPILDNGDERPYAKLELDASGAIHFAFTDGNPAEVPTNSVYYLRLTGDVLTKADGTPVARVDELPLAPREGEVVFDSVQEGVSAWIWDVAVGADGHPVIAYVAFASKRDHRYRYARWNGTAWDDHEITAAGGWFPTVRQGSQRFTPYYSGGLALDHADPSVVYLSREIDGVFEIERWVTPDGGRSWMSRAITANSEQNNVRPYVPVGDAPDGPEVIWMYGDYIDWIRYSTALKMKLARAGGR